MFKRTLFAAVIVLSLMSVAFAAVQEPRGPRLEITGLNPMDLPTVSVSVNVFDIVGQPVPDLTAGDFSVVGELADRAEVVSVRSFSDEAVPINVVLMIDVSSSMAGMPIESARAAASAFIEAIGPNDPVAVMTFSTGTNLIQDFTTDKDALNAAVSNLGFGGETFLFDGALAAVEKAAESENTRRAVILLSDGAQYDTTLSSRATQQDVLDLAVVNGVPVYTIGLGFGADRHYLENLSENTNALFRESPTPAELEDIFNELAALLRTQYEVVLNVDVPLDGTTYDLELEVETPQGTAQATGRLRAPVPVPIVRLPELPDTIESLTEVQPEIVADDALTDVTIALDGAEQISLPEEPYIYIIDPVVLAPGTHSLSFTATDEDGDTGTASVDFTVAALPSTITIDPPLSGEIATEQTFSLDISGQTETESVTLTQDGGEAVELTAPYSFSIDPFNLAPGEHTTTITVTNAGGATATAEGQFTVPDLPIQFSLSGLESGQTLEEETEIGVAVESSQAPVTASSFTLGGETLEPTDSGTITLNPLTLPPGPATLSVTVENELGQTTTETFNFQVAPQPPTITLSGLELGETIDADRTIEIDVTSQTPVTVNAQVDGEAVPVTEGDPITLTLSVLELEPGAHVLSVEATDEAGSSATAETAFTVAEGPAQTATAMITAEDTATQETQETETASETPTPAVDVLPTVLARANELAATAGVRETGEARAAQIQATREADVQAEDTATTEAAEAEQATLDAQATTDAEAGAEEADQQATVDAEATANLVATINAGATLDAQATTDALASQTTEAPAETATPTIAAEDLDATIDAAAANALAGISRLTTATAEAQEALLAPTTTAEAEATAQAAAQQATADAEQTAVQVALNEESTATQAAADEQATTDAQATADAEATANADLTATQAAADEQATQDTLDQEATTDAETTEQAEPTEEVTEEDATEAPTEVAQAADPSATPTSGDEDGTPLPTITPIGTLIPAQAETTPGNEALIPLIVIIIVIVVVLLLVYFLARRGRQPRR